MKFFAISLLLATLLDNKSNAAYLPVHYVGQGFCADSTNHVYKAFETHLDIVHGYECPQYCQQYLFANLVGYEVTSAYSNGKRWCNCLFSDALPSPVPLYSPPVDNQVDDVAADGSGPIATSVPFQNDRTCYKFAKPTIADFTKMGATGSGRCLDSNGNHFAQAWSPARPWIDLNEAEQVCPVYCGQNVITPAFRGMFIHSHSPYSQEYNCVCLFEHDPIASGPFLLTYHPVATNTIPTTNVATGAISQVDGDGRATCYRYTNPNTYAPVTHSPTTHSPSTANPTSHSPSSLAPSSHAPVASVAPTTHAPSSLSPVAAATTTQPSTHAPSSHAPVATMPPSTHAPASMAPSSHSPTSTAPSSHSPTSVMPTSHAPISSSPVSAGKSSKTAKNSKGGTKSTKNSKKV